MEVEYDAAFRKVVEAQERLSDPWYRQLAGARLRVLRLRLRLNQNAVAESAGISNTALCKIESGAQTIKLEEAIAIGRALGVSIDEFLSGEPEHSTSM